MLSKTVDILAINETRLDSSIQNGEVRISLDIPLKGKIEIDMGVVWRSILGTQ